MVEFFRDRRVAAAVMALALLAPMAARAADMPYAPPVGIVEEERVTFGTGWYLRGDVSAASDIKLSIGNKTIPDKGDFVNSWSAGLGFGYKYNEWLRSDVTADWRNPRRFEGNTTSVTCQFTAVSYTTCSDYTRARLTAFHVLVNGYVDLPVFASFTPYVGVGVGLSNIYQKVSRTWFEANGNPHQPSWVDASGATVYYNWDQSRSASSLQFAWALMAGAAYAVTPHAAIDVGYRYLNQGNVANYASLYGTTQQTLRSHELRVGLRYTPD